MIPSAPWVPPHGDASCAPYEIRWRALCVALLCVAGSVAQVFSTSTVVYHDSLVVYDEANATCNSNNGGLAVTPSDGYLSVVTLSALGQPLWLGGQELTAQQWWWLGGLLKMPILFYSNNACVFGPCPWMSGEPKTGNAHLRLLTNGKITGAVFQSAIPSLSTRFSCEIPYASTFTCLRSSGGTEYDVVTKDCQQRGGYLATVPSLSAWTTILATSSCANLPDTRIGADDYDADAFTSQKFTVSSRGYFHWRWGLLGAEYGGKGRLLSTGAYPNTQLFGFPTLPYASGQPTLGTSQNTIEVIMPLAQLNDRTWRLATDITSYICEFPAVIVLPTGNCFSNPNVVVTNDSVSGCRVSGGRIVINGTLIMDRVTIENTVIEVQGGGTRTLKITRSTLTDVGILMRGRFSGGSELLVTDTTVTVASRLDLQQPADVVAWMHIDGSFEQSCALTVVRNAIVMDISAPGMSCAMLYSSAPLLLSFSALLVANNSVRLSSQGLWTAFLRSDGSVTVSGQSSIVITDNTATIQSATLALFVYLASLTVGAAAVVDVSENVVTLSGVRGTFFAGDSAVDGLATWLHNTAQYGQSVPQFVQSAVALGVAGSRAVLSENVMTADTGVQIPTLELSGPVSGPGSLAVGCTSFFGVSYTTLPELRGIVPAFDRIILEPCTSRFVPPIIDDGNSVDGSTASSDEPSTPMVVIIIGSVVAFVALVLLSLIVLVLLRRRREVSQQRRSTKSTSQSELSGTFRSSRRSSRSSLKESSRGNRRPSSRSSQSASSVVTGTTASQSVSQW